MSRETWTINAFADESKVDRRTLAKWLASYEPVRIDGRTRYYSLPDIIAAIRENGAFKSKSQDEEKEQRFSNFTLNFLRMSIEAYRQEQITYAKLLKLSAMVGFDEITVDHVLHLMGIEESN